MKNVKKYWKLTLLITIFLIGVLGIYVACFELRDEVMEIYFFDLDRGRSIFIRTPHNQTILIDGGQNSQIMRELTKILPFYRRRIDTIIVTNSFPKNVGGLSEVVRRYEVGKIVAPALMGTSTALEVFEKVVADKKLLVEKVMREDRLEIDGIGFEVLFPVSSFKYNKTSRPELVLNISHNSRNILLLGDVSKTIQKSLIPALGQADLIEYAHSAGDSRTSGDLFEKLSPKYAIIKKQIRASSIRVLKNPPKKPSFNIDKQIGTEVINLETDGNAKFILDEIGISTPHLK